MSGETGGTTVGITEEMQNLLRRMQQAKVIAEMTDGYRLGIAIAIARGEPAPERLSARTTFVNIGTLDPDGTIRSLITELYPESSDQPYRLAERLAEAGMRQIEPLFMSGQLDFGLLFDDLHLNTPAAQPQIAPTNDKG